MTQMENKTELYKEIKKILVEMFEIPADDIQPESKLYEDLDLDSIDAVDLVIKLQEITGKKFKPDDFKSIRTVDDMVIAAQNILEA